MKRLRFRILFISKEELALLPTVPTTVSGELNQIVKTVAIFDSVLGLVKTKAVCAKYLLNESGLIGIAVRFYWPVIK